MNQSVGGPRSGRIGANPGRLFAAVGPKYRRAAQSADIQCEGELTLDPIHGLQRGHTHTNGVDLTPELVASLAHEITEPIAAVELGAEACLRWLDRDPPVLEEARRVLLSIIKDAKRAGGIVERTRSLYSEQRPDEPIDGRPSPQTAHRQS